VFTARYALSPYIKQIRFVFTGLIFCSLYRLTTHLTTHQIDKKLEELRERDYQESLGVDGSITLKVGMCALDEASSG
jgi:hypothetical protein